MTPLPPALTTSLMPGEAPSSFCSRVAMIVGRTARMFCLDMGLTFQRIVDGEAEELALLAERTRVRPDDLVANAIVRFETRRYTYRGQELVRDSLSRKVLRVCPHCLRQDLAEGRGHQDVRPYGRTTWMIEALRSCPMHRSELVVITEDDHPNRVHDFAQLLRPAHSRLDSLCEAARERKSSALEEYLLQRLGGASPSCWLDTLPFHAVAKSCEVFGAVSMFGADVRTVEMTDELWHRAGGEGYRLLSRGEEGVRELLIRLQESFPGDRLGMRTTYGRLHDWLSHDNDEEAYEPLRGLLRDVAAETMPLAAGSEAFGSQVKARRLHSVRSASREIGVHPKRLRKLLHLAGFLDAEAMSLSDENAQFPADESADFLEKVSRSMGLNDVREYLRLPRPLEQALVKEGILVPFFHGSNTTIDHAFDRHDLDEFLARLVADARPLGEEDWKLVSVPRAATRACVSAVEVVRLLLEGRLSTVRLDPGEGAFAAIRVDADEVKRGARPEREGLSLRQVEKRLKTNSCVVKALVDLDHLPSRTLVNPISRRTQRIVLEGDVEIFVARFISAQNFARERSVHIGGVTAKLRALGIEPAFDPGTVQATFYDREQVKQVQFP